MRASDLLLDVGPLREHAGFRRLWIGSTLSSIGSALTAFALPLQLYELTHSTFDVGLLAVVELVPTLAIGLGGGALSDRLPRRAVIGYGATAAALVSAALAAEADLAQHRLWPLYLLAAIAAACRAVGAPARRAAIRDVLPSDRLPAGLALQRVSFQLTLIAGPALAGLITAAPGLGLRGCYAIDALSFTASLHGLGALPRATGARPSSRHTLAAVLEGLRVVARSQRLLGALLVDLDATVLALPVSLFPAIDAQRFGADPRTLGLFATAIGVGGLVTAGLSGPLRHVRRPGAAMVAAVVLWGGAFAGFAVAGDLATTLATLALAGGADTVTVVLRGAIIQSDAPDALRGRITAAEYVTGVAGGQLGELEAGALGSLTSPATAALAGGLAAIAGALVLAAALPRFTSQRDDGVELGRAGGA